MLMAAEQARDEMHAVAAQQHDPARSIAQQGTDAGPVEPDLDRLETEHGLAGKLARLALVAQADVAAQAELAGEQRQLQDRRQRAPQLDGDRDHAWPAASMSTTARTGEMSYPAFAALAASAAGLPPRLASARAHSSVERVPERQ